MNDDYCATFIISLALLFIHNKSHQKIKKKI